MKRILLMAMIFATMSISAFGRSNKFYAGAAKRDITPTAQQMPYSLLGPLCFQFVHDSLSVRALYLENGDEKAMIVTYDLPLVPYGETMRQHIAELTGLPKASVMVAATHNHNAPYMLAPMFGEDENGKKQKSYSELVMKSTDEAVKAAVAAKQEARLGFGRGKSYINVNRDEVMEDGKAVVGNNYERPSDKSLYVLRIEKPDGTPISLLVNYACHAVFMNGNNIDGKFYISSDIPGNTSTRLEKQLGGVVLWTSNAAGDQNPRIMTNFGADENKKTLLPKCIGAGADVIFDALVNEHVRDILKVNKTIKCEEVAPAIKGIDHPTEVQGRTDKPVTYDLSMLRLGDINILGINAEVCTSIGAACVATSDKANTILITHCNGYMTYVSDNWMWDHQSFEVGGSLSARGAAEPAFVAAFKEMMKTK